MIKYSFNKDHKILYLIYKGKIYRDDISELYTKILNDDSLPQNLLIFQDENKAEFINSENLINFSIKYIKLLNQEFRKIKVAVWQNDPVKTAYSYFYKTIVARDQYEINVFYTKEAALVWIKE